MKHVVTMALAATLSFSTLQADDGQTLIKAVQEKYAAGQSFKQYKIRYNFAFANPYQSFDYKSAESGHTVRVTEIDMIRKHYAEHDINTWPGGFVFEYKDFQNDEISRLYDANGVIFGKRIRALELDSYELAMTKNNILVDFLAVGPLLKADPTNLSIAANAMSGTASIIHTDVDGKKTTYEFSKKPLRLHSVHSEKEDRKFVYENYEEHSGLTYATKITRYDEGNYRGIYNLDGLETISAVTPSKLMVPEGYGPIMEAGDRKLTSTEIASNIHLITDSSAGRNSLVEVSENGLIVLGAPVSDTRSEKMLALIEQEFPGKTINYVYVTHAHSDHIGGLRPFAKMGVPILADKYSIEAIKAYPRFKNDIDAFTFQEITHKEKLSGLTFHIPGNTHAKGQSFVHFEDTEILYEGDFLEIPYDNTIATHIADVSKQFVKYVRRENLGIKRIVGHHRNNDISPATMDAYYAAHAD